MISKYIKQTGKHSIIYGIGNLVSKIIAFILIPIYTRVLSPEEYGILSLMTITLTITSTLLSLSMHTTLFRFYIYDYTNKKERKELISTALLSLYSIIIPIISVLLIYSENIANLAFKNASSGYLLRLVFLAAFFEIGSMMSLAILRAKAKSKTFSILVILRFLIQLGMIIFFVVILRQGVEGALKALLISFIIFFTLNIPNIIKNISLSFSLTKLRKIMRFGLPLIPAALATWIITMIDRFILERIKGSSEVGIYTLGYNVGMIINFLFVAPIQLAWAQIRWSILKKEKDAKRIFSYLMTYYILVGAILSMCLSLLADEIIFIISTEPYQVASVIIPFISFSYLLYGIYFMINIGINLKKKTEFIALVLAISATLNIILNYILIPKYSMLGAAIATIISYLILVVLTYIISNYYYKVEYQWVRIMKIFIIILLVLLIDHYIIIDSLLYSIIIKISLVFVFIISLLFIKFFEKREIRKIKEFMSLIILKLKKVKTEK